MSEENNNLGDDLKDKAKDLAGDAKETAKEFSEDAKDTANEFKESWNQATNNGENKKLLAGLLGIFVGWLGIHKFILGYQKEGIIMLICGVVGWFLCGIPTMIVSVIGIIEGIMYLTKSDEEFYNTYQAGRKPWF
ncbi:MAG: TM2 domain-containing protein [Bacteroidetes bacterium]|nr:TM2 domain-containing protein [Bacteroidota bacterium]